MDLTEVKSLLKTYCKQNHYKSPKYKLIFITGEEYKKSYTISVEIKGVLTVADSGISRRIAEKKAAIKALVELKVINKEDINKENQVVVNENNDNNLLPGAEEESDDLSNEELVNNETVMEKVNEVSVNTKNIVLNKPAISRGNDMKFIDENFNFQPKKTQNQSTNGYKIETLSPNGEQHLKNENVCDLDENPICGIIKYCLRNGIPLPFYDFNFNNGLFSTQCRVESNGTEFVGFGKSATLRVAKMIASQEVIDELKKMNLYLKADPLKRIVVQKNEYNQSTEYSSLTIKMKSTEEKKIENNFESIPKSYQKEDNFEDLKDFDGKNYSSTLSSMDDNNNPKDSHFDKFGRKVEQNYRLIIDNPIGYLQKYCAKNKLSVPQYEEELSSGKDHCPLFRFKCSLAMNDGQITGIGLGNTKKSAKQAAAENVVRLLLNL